MQIKQRLLINNVILILSVTVMTAMLLVTVQHINRAMEQNFVASRLMAAQFERLALRTDYLRTGSERARDQVRAKSEQIGKLLQSADEKFSAPEDRQTVADLMAVQESSGRIIEAIIANRRDADLSRDSALANEVEERLLSQLNIRVYEAVILGGTLLESSRLTLVSALTRAGGSMALVLLLSSVASLVNSLTMSRTIATRIDRLRDSAAAIGQGNLDHRIDIRGDDELTRLSTEFNEMAARLGASYHTLEEEIEERKQAENALRESERKLTGVLESMPDAFVSFDTGMRYTYVNANAEQLQATPREELLGKDVRIVYPDAESYKTICLYERVIRDKEPLMATSFHAGFERWVEIRAFPTPDGVSVFYKDVSTQVKAEEALRKAHNELALRMEERLRELHEKEVLLKEIHHRVKNNLQVISSLVSMQADESRSMTVREVLSDVSDRVRSMALVHEKLYHTENLARIDFADYAQSLLGYLWRVHGSDAEVVRLVLDLEPVELPVDTAMPCGLILNELAGNALKHAFRGRSGGDLTVALHRTGENRISLSVRDNGVGLPAGFDWRQAHSLGLRLVQMLAGQLKATVEISSGDGTGFEIAFGDSATEDVAKIAS